MPDPDPKGPFVLKAGGISSERRGRRAGDDRVAREKFLLAGRVTCCPSAAGVTDRDVMSYRSLRRRCRSHVVAEMSLLESRALFAAVFPTANEQYLVELINRGRSNPSAEASRYGIALNEGVPSNETISTAPKQPLAINPNITDAARKHSQWMIDTDTFAHDETTSSGTTDPKQRMINAGYVFPGSWTWGENIAWNGTTASTTDAVAG